MALLNVKYFYEQYINIMVLDLSTYEFCLLKHEVIFINQPDTCKQVKLQLIMLDVWLCVEDPFLIFNHICTNANIFH